MNGTQKKAVAIVGAGPAGLIAAKALLRSNGFEITIFEKTSKIGGLWAPGGLIDPQMRTNLCRFTVAFSGLSWEAVDLGRDGKPAPLYPRAWEVNEYLQEFSRRYIPDSVFKFRTAVINAELLEGAETTKWKITTKTTKIRTQITNETVQIHEFDYLLVASGCFSQPLIPDELATPHEQTSSTPILHSTEHEKIKDLCNNEQAFRKSVRKILIVGGSHSGSELATNLAFQLSSSSHKDNTNSSEIHFLSSRNMVSLPKFLRTSDTAVCSFEPADLKLYNRSNLPGDIPATFKYNLWDPEMDRNTIKMLRGLKAGGDEIREIKETSEQQLNAVINSSYSLFTQLGVINPSEGRLQTIETSPRSQSVSAVIETPVGNLKTIESLAAIICATGFDASASVSFLSEKVKSSMEYDPQCPTLPLVLDASYLSQNTSAPNLAVIGFAAQYWGAMEMQARAITRAWTDGSFFPGEEERRSVALPPNPFADYVGLMEQAARELQLDRVDGKWSRIEGPICPARYLDISATPEEKVQALATIQALQDLQDSIDEKNPFLARAVYSALLGTWYEKTSEEESGDKHQRQEFTFQPRGVTNPEYDFEYLVAQSSSSSIEHTIFRCSEDDTLITIWKTQPGDPAAVGELMTKMDFGPPLSASESPDCVEARLLRVIELYQLARYLLDHYRGTSLTCRYSFPRTLSTPSTQNQLGKTVMAAIAQVFSCSPMLQPGIAGVDTAKPIRMNLGTIDVRDHVHWTLSEQVADHERHLHEEIQVQLDTRSLEITERPA
ncbi:hypothetical protein BCR34DRAFT_600764 [Clohesyomyces aquaticus]|uniref:FAD/NAD(P)-binding domain-containing protein n=1 Tax=Clohesyomyces aquaticus TaxID=1231657 RepID=A0A1Y1ZPN4_9PLEO|nr:hypothetical protein BCR34DRAFT_600764 [Clohesyomyces aquaticus]